MKKYIWIMVTVIVIGVGAFIVFKILNGSQTTPNQTTTWATSNSGSTNVTSSGSGLQVSTSTQTSQISIQNINGIALMVNDFVHDPATVATSTFPQHYFLAGGLNPAASNAPYSIFYIATDQSFTITLLQEPIAQTRQAAEQYLMQKLGISEADMCRLKYQVGVPNFVNSIYSGTNLGFSFCPGATAL